MAKKEKNFLGNNGNFLSDSADYLLSCSGHSRYNLADLSDKIIISNSSRINRRLEELLVLKTAKLGLVLRPPIFTTPKLFVDSISQEIALSELNFNREINNFEKLIILEKAIRENQNILSSLLPKNSLSFSNTARQIASIFDEIGREGYHPQEIYNLLGKEGISDDSDRWVELIRLYEEYSKGLFDNGLIDYNIFRINRLFEKKHNAASRDSSPLDKSALSLYFLGVVDYPKVLDLILRDSVVFGHIEALINSKSSDDSGFDDFGGLIQDYWIDKKISIEKRNLIVCPSPQSLCQIVDNAFKEVKKNSDAVIISTSSDFKYELLESKLNFRDPEGVSLSKSVCFDLIQNIVQYNLYPDINKFKSVLLNPIWYSGDNKEISRFEVISFIEKHRLKRDTEKFIIEKLNCKDYLKDFFSNVQDKISLLKFTDYNKINLENIFNRLDELILFIYKTVDSAHDVENEFLREYLSVKFNFINSSVLDSSEPTPYQVIKGVLSEISAKRCQIISKDEGVDLIGILEAPLDDTPIKVVVGLNEGFFPETLKAHPFLPDKIRVQLKMPNNLSREARDVFILDQIVRDSSDKYFVMFSNNREGQYLLPSKILLKGSLEERVDIFNILNQDLEFQDSNLQINNLPGSWYEVERPVDKKNSDVFSVTELSNYLECPYYYYLKNIKKIGDGAYTPDLDPRELGNLVHGALSSLTQLSENDLSRSEFIFSFLMDSLFAEYRKQYSSAISNIIKIQISNIEKIFQKFALSQAEHFNKGWRIKYSEYDFKILNLAGLANKNYWIEGRIDRVDYNEIDNQLLIIDYKTGKVKDPEKKHYDKSTGKWKDLQLPLYQLALQDDVKGASIITSYLHIFEETKVEKKWEITQDILGSASNCAVDVINNINDSRFEPSGNRYGNRYDILLGRSASVVDQDLELDDTIEEF